MFESAVVDSPKVGADASGFRGGDLPESAAKSGFCRDSAGCFESAVVDSPEVGADASGFRGGDLPESAGKSGFCRDSAGCFESAVVDSPELAQLAQMLGLAAVDLPESAQVLRGSRRCEASVQEAGGTGRFLFRGLGKASRGLSTSRTRSAGRCRRGPLHLAVDPGLDVSAGRHRLQVSAAVAVRRGAAGKWLSSIQGSRAGATRLSPVQAAISGVGRVDDWYNLSRVPYP